MICLSAGAARAAVIDTSASVAITVQELLDGAPGSVINDSDTLNDDGTNTPLFATGNLRSTDLFGNLIAAGQAYAEYVEPTLSNEQNPEELTLEIASFANGDSVAYTVTADAVETRTLIFTRPGNPLAEPEISFGLSGTREVESRISISGAIVFWSTHPDVSLEESLAQLSFTVTREDTGAELFSTSLSVVADAQGGVATATEGPIVFEQVTLAELAQAGVDEASLAVLEEVAQNGSLLVLVLPLQEHPYQYTVRADQSFELTAELNAKVRNVPGGTGAAVTLGGPFENLADFMAEALTGTNGSNLEQSVNAVLSARTIGLVRSQDTGSGGSLCGAFGAETIPVVALGLYFTFARRRRS